MRLFRGFARGGRKGLKFNEILRKKAEMRERENARIEEISQEGRLEEMINDDNSGDFDAEGSEINPFDQREALENLELTEAEQVQTLFRVDDFEGQEIDKTSGDELSAEEIAKKNYYKERQNFVKSELLDEQFDPREQKLVQRPTREAVWGLGGQLLRRKESKKFQKS